MENFRAKQYENFNFEGKVGPFQTDDEIELLGEIKKLENEIEYLRDYKEKNAKRCGAWFIQFIAWLITFLACIFK